MGKLGEERRDPSRAIAAIGVLGPIEAWDQQGRAVRITPGQQRVLAALLESVNRVVAADVLREKLWPGDDPEDSTALLQTNVSTLRKLFVGDEEPTAELALRRRGAGYELCLLPHQYDWARFQGLRAAARRAIGTGRHLLAKAFLLDALRLWRGEALLGLPSADFAGPFAQELEESRASADQELIEVALALGEHHELIPRLRHLVERNPLDEGLTRLLMLALFRCGRQADALSIYSRSRRHLAEEGLLPTPLLSRTEVQILTHHPEVLAPSPPSSGVTRPGVAMAGALLFGRWNPCPGPPPALGDAEVSLLVEGAGGELLEAGGATLVAGFDDIGPAMGAAVILQSALRRRCGPLGRFVVHDGPATTASPVVFDRCERILAQADEGQVLFIRPTDHHAARQPPRGTELKDLGEHQVIGGEPPVHLFQLMGPDFDDADRPFAPVRALPADNLPDYDKPLGRELLVEEVVVQMSRHRLVTLTGAGGVGKRRVAIEVARTLLRHYRDGVYLVQLEWLSDPELVPGTIADALGLTRPRGIPVADIVLRALANRHVLLVLDSCEHHLGACGPLVERVLNSCPRVSVLATSLRRLGCDGEHVLVVPPLALPPAPHPDDRAGPGAAQDDQAVLTAASVQLFLRHLQAATPSGADLASVATICRLVDGIPLAIILAAARAGQLGLANLERALERAVDHGGTLRLLDADRVGPANSRRGRLEDTLEWTFSLLGGHERRLLAELSVFAGAFSLADAQELCSGSPEPVDVAAPLCRLADCSAVVVQHDQPAGSRYRLLQPVRDFAAIKLAADPGASARLARRHADIYLGVARRRDEAVGTAAEAEQLAILDASLDNVRTALRWALDAGDASVALELGARLWRWWFFRGRLAEGRRYLARALELEEEPSTAGNRALGGASYLAWWQGDLGYTRTSARETLARAEVTGDAWAAAWGVLGVVAAEMFSPTGSSTSTDIRRATAYFIEEGLNWEAGQALQLVAGPAWFRGNYAAAAEAFALARDISRAAAGETFTESLAAHGLMLALTGQIDEGSEEVEAALEAADRNGHRVGACQALAYRAAIARYEGDHDEASRLYILALRLAHELGHAWITLWAMDGLASAPLKGRVAVAARLLGRVEAMASATGIRLAPREQALHAEAVARVRAQLTVAGFERAFSDGARLSTDEAVGLAIGLAG